MKFSLVSLIFLRRSLVFPILLFSYVSLHCSLEKVFLSLLAILWSSAFRRVYLSFSPLPFTSPFTVICQGCSDSHFAFCISFSWWLWSTPKLDWLYPLQLKMEKLYTVSKNKTRSWLWLRSWTLIAKFRLKLKKVGKTTRPFRYDPNQIH